MAYTLNELKEKFSICCPVCTGRLDVEVVESSVLVCPMSGTISVLASGLAAIFSFGISSLRKVLHYVFMTLVAPLKFLDAIYTRLPGAEDIAGNVYVIIEK